MTVIPRNASIRALSPRGRTGRLLAIAGMFVAVGMAAGCGNVGHADGSDKLQVLTTFTVIQDMAQEVAGDKLQVRSITKPGAEVHHYEPTPQDIGRAQDADLILDNGLYLELWFEKFLGQVKDTPHATLTKGIKPIPISGNDYEGKPNPHSWMSPKNAFVYVENIRRAFVELDPDNADTFNANAKAYSDKLEAIGDDLRSNLSDVPKEQRWLASCEGAFSYLVRDFGMREAYLWPVNQDVQGTPQQVKGLIDTIRANKIPAAFCESTVNDKAQQRVAKETGASFAGTLYVDSLSKPGGPVPSYLELLEYDTKLVAAGLKGES